MKPGPMSNEEARERFGGAALGRQPKRIQRERSRGWRMPEGAFYVGRPGPWGSPFTIGQCVVTTDGLAPGGVRVVIDLELSLELYQRWAEHQVSVGALRLEELRGKDLVCWCGLDQACHADILLELANA